MDEERKQQTLRQFLIEQGVEDIEAEVLKVKETIYESFTVFSYPQGEQTNE